MKSPVTFPSTHWSEVVAAGHAEPLLRAGALDSLLARYYSPLRTYLIRVRGLSLAQAEDVLHDFVCDKLLQQRLLHTADRGRGRFRALLVTALTRFLISSLRKARAGKRSAGGAVPVEDYEERLPGGTIPTEEFDLAWARQVITLATERLQNECEQAGRADVWGVFHARILAPLVEGAAPVAYDELVVRHGLPSPTAAYNLLLTAKRMYVRCLEAVIGEYAPGARRTTREVAELHAVLARAGKNGGATA